MQISRSYILKTRQRVIDHITHMKSLDSNYRVIDIGGVAGGSWSSSYIDMCIDINAADTATSMSIDICDYTQWSRLLSYVESHGKFDYCICTHTLEDVYNPITALQLMPLIAQAGIITAPSIAVELSRHEGNYLGYIHHRWILAEDIGSNGILLVPKLSVLESLIKLNFPYYEDQGEIVFEWADSIPYCMFMNNYLGPSKNEVITAYRELIARG